MSSRECWHSGNGGTMSCEIMFHLFISDGEFTTFS